jgi:glycosyltransferase involved in cell wall biosynthesis
LRILLCSYHYPPSIGGVERQSALLAEGLCRRGHEVRVITTGRPRREREGALEIQRLPIRESGVAGMLAYAAWANASLLAAARWADLIHAQQALPPAATLALTARALRKPLVVTNHGSGPKGAMDVMRSLPLGKAGLRALRSAQVVALTEGMADEMRRSGLPPRAIIPNGVELPAPSDEPRGRSALFVGRLDPIKGLDTLARAAALLPGVAVDVVGDGPLRASLGPPLRLHGAAEDVSPWLRKAGVFVLPSRAEGFGMALLEAMAHGCACVATAVDGSRALLGEDAGILVPPDDPQALAAAISQVLDDSERMRALGQRARGRAAERFSAQAMVDAYERLYASLVA